MPAPTITSIRDIDFSQGTLKNLEVVNNVLQLKKRTSTQYFDEGTYESEVIDLGTTFLDINAINRVVSVNTSALQSVKIYVSTTNDFVVYSPFELVNNSGIISTSSRYIKFKIEVRAGFKMESVSFNDFESSESGEFTANPFVEINGNLQLKTLYPEPLNSDPTFTEGILYRKVIQKNDFRTIENIEVK